ncbi:hypothetical protein [Psychroserpens sp. NJDZ02]|uniref:hypothetical protein n=1 Tax=Psychroserpens sp. NJDZ02 TaxID=2570561 RepID=UPI0010A8D7ED|nr:hypothetical protein [Psychroserpens sp. NJDZ02]QCE40962.1 hypothetical protein E9099_05865 [Psychroserpens sp. NJDZ02]
MKLQNIIINILLFLLIGCKSVSSRKKLHAIPYYIANISSSELNIESIDDFVSTRKVNKRSQIVEIKNKYDESYENIVSTYTEAINMKPLFNHSFSKNIRIGSESVEIENGYPKGTYTVRVLRDTLFFTLKKVDYIKSNISGELKIINFKDSLLYQTTFKKGTGYWKDYYYKESKLREEGNVKNNYKEGLWKYYSLSGDIDSTKTYTLKDAVDVRYPYCFFNKNEPCY